jgi:non-homologous end joining protein Ku
MNYPKKSRSARALHDAKKSREEAEEKMKQANELYEKALRRSKLKDILDEYSVDEILDIVEEKKEDENALQEAELEDDIQFVDCENSTDDDIKITDS